MKKLETRVEKAEVRHLASLARELYWPDAVAKAHQNEAEKEAIPIEQVLASLMSIVLGNGFLEMRFNCYE